MEAHGLQELRFIMEKGARRATPRNTPRFPARLSLSLLVVAAVPALAQGPLTPPGPPGPTLKSLDQIEPRIPISALPFFISTPGSYYVTTNLTGEVTNGITITAGDVLLDLGGHTLSGNSFQAGIRVMSAVTNVVIRNGSIHHWFGFGIDAALARAVVFEKLNVSHNSRAGLRVGPNSRVVDCAANSNSEEGILAEGNCLISRCLVSTNAKGIVAGSGTVNECVAAGNSVVGIDLGPGTQATACHAVGTRFGHGFILRGQNSLSRCVVEDNANVGIFGNGAAAGFHLADCVVQKNGAEGVLLQGNMNTISGCLVRANASTGLRADEGGQTVRHCVFSGNGEHGLDLQNCCNLVTGCNVVQNARDGIRVGSASLLEHNLCTLNGTTNNGAGIRVLGGANRIEKNHLQSNGVGLHVGAAGNLILQNSAISHSTNYLTIGTQNIGPIITVTGTITNANPWANFSY